MNIDPSTGVLYGAFIRMWPQQSNGADCTPTWNELVAHEIGHVLGLGDVDWDPSCTGSIMGSNPQYVSGDQCSQAAANYYTVAEQEQEALDQCNSSCSGTCTGQPPTCQTPGGEGYGCPYWNCSPLVLDLNGDGIQTTGIDDPVSFDVTGDGIQELVAWTNPTTEEGFLWIDVKPNGRVDDGTELFGIGTILLDGRRARDGFEALSERDLAQSGGNGDGRITTADRVWNHLRLWVDANHNGICEPSESGPIEQFGIVAINLHYFVNPQPDANGNVHKLRSTFTRRMHGNGRPRLETFEVHDVFFRQVP